MLRGQDRLLLALAALGDLFENLADAGGLASFSYRQIYGFIPPKYKKHNFYMAVKNSLKVGNIDKVIKKGEPYLRLTGRGEKKIVRYFPLFSLQKKKWDKKWRVLFFDIEETNRAVRDKFRETLRRLGFGQFQKSVYLSPFPIEKEMKEFIENLGLRERACLLVSPKFSAGDERLLAKKEFKLEKLNKEYERILKKAEEVKKDDLEEKRRLGAKFLEILSIDPFLPEELLPDNWLGLKARKVVFRFLKELGNR